MSNLSILEQNIIAGFGAYHDAESCERTFLSLIDRDGVLAAEQAANEWGKVSDFMGAVGARMEGARDTTDGPQPFPLSPEVMEFIQTRHLNYRHPNSRLRAVAG